MEILLIFGIILILLYLYVRYLERHTIFQPTRGIEGNPGDVGLKYENLYFSTSDNLKLHGWFIPYENARISLLFCHGNGGNLSNRLEKIRFFNRLGLNLLVFDYRGYGLSQGSPSENGLYRDARAAYDYLASDKFGSPDNRKTVVYGASLGGAVAVDLAKNRPVDGLILESTFASIVDMAKIIYPIIPSFLIRNRFDSFAKMSEIDIPKLIIHSDSDDFIPIEQAEKLYSIMPGPREFLKVTGRHSDAFFASEPIVIPAMQKFFRSL